MVTVTNEAGEVLCEQFHSDAEACRWWLDNGRAGDTLTDTGELMAAACLDVLGADEVAASELMAGGR